jgi:hypothetical protein
MNLTVNTHSSTWKNARNRYVIGIGGVALAITVAIAGISALPSSSGSRQASVTPQIQSRPSTLFQTEADAALAVLGDIVVSPQFGSISDAYEAAVALGFAQADLASAETRDSALGLGQPGERSASVVPQFANSVDAYEASIAGLSAPISAPKPITPFTGSLGLNDYAGMEITEIPAPATTAPQFASMTDAVEALWYLEVQQVSVAPGLAQPVSTVDSPDAYLGLGQPGERSVIPQLFSNYVDAWEASIAQ